MRLYSTKEFAELVGVSTRTLKRWRHDGKIKPVKTGKNNSVFYSDKQLAKFRVTAPLNEGFGSSSGDKFSDNLARGDKKNSSGDTAACIEEENIKFVSSEVKISIDNAHRTAFNISDKTKWQKFLEDRKEKIYSKIKLEIVTGKNLDKFDEFVYCAVESEYSAGNEITTVDRLFHLMGGSRKITDKIKKEITESIEKLACSRVSVNMTEINDKRKYVDCGIEELIFTNYILPCKTVTAKVNGQITECAIKVTEIPPLLKISDMKKQFTTCDKKLLGVPVRFSKVTASLRYYLLKRIKEIIGSHKHKRIISVGRGKNKIQSDKVQKMCNVILLETVFEKCGLSDAERNRHAEYRDTIAKILNHFKAEKLITDWQFRKEGGISDAVMFDFQTK